VFHDIGPSGHGWPDRATEAGTETPRPSSETITDIFITTGFSSGTDLAALLRWIEINGETC